MHGRVRASWSPRSSAPIRKLGANNGSCSSSTAFAIRCPANFRHEHRHGEGEPHPPGLGPGGWAPLPKFYRNYSPAGSARLILRKPTEHKHQALSPRTRDRLMKMTWTSANPIFRTLASDGSCSRTAFSSHLRCLPSSGETRSLNTSRCGDQRPGIRPA